MNMQFISRRAVAAIALALALVAIAGGGEALAHVHVESTTPASGGKARTTIKTVRVLFSGPVRSGTLKVYRSNGSKVSSGSGGRDPRNIKRVVASLHGHLKAGRYTAKWTVVAADGHHQHGSFKFRLKRP
jgi:methionine-rich copper-binding protein CopC